MARTTTAFNFCNAIIRLDNAGGTLQDISGSSNKVDPQFDNDVGEFKTFGDAWRGRLVCGKDAQVDLEIYMSSTANEAWDILKNWYSGSGAARTLQIDFPSGAQNEDRIQGEFVLETMSWSGDASEPAPTMVSATLLPHGAVTFSAIP